ncbi:MAG: alpha/beta fold hydrolase [Planctomycetia bacterium]|nr:alpha/beta fold hydrolase [Planctomycetia bacterium]
MAAPPDTSSEPRDEAPAPAAVGQRAEPRAEAAFAPAAPDEAASEAPDEPDAAAAADEPSRPAPETTEADPTEGASPPDRGPTPGHGDTGSESASETTPRAMDQPTAPPSSVVIHFATNRNRLAAKDREWLTYFWGFFTSTPAVVVYVLLVLTVLILPWLGKRSWAARALLAGAVGLCAMACLEAYVRSQLRGEMTGELYGSRPTTLSYGTCEISVPPAENRRPGELSRPVSVWIFEAPENPDEHFLLRQVTEHKDQSAFYASLSAQLKKSGVNEALLFIHGYNVSFEDAIFRTAQLAVDLEFPGAPIAFCWPSHADPVKYTFDEQQAEVSIPALRELLDGLATQSGAKRIHVIAHSMGNRVLAGALRSMDPAANARNKEVLRELVLAAPDIDSRVFQSQLLPHIIRNARHCTLYASSHDRALLMSRYFHNYQRLGETRPDLLVTNELDTIDASLVDTSLMGHSYIANAQSIVADLHDLVVRGKQPAERLGLEAFERGAAKYWLIKPQPRIASDPLLRR